MKTKFAIIGGGVAGLCAAIRLSELGEEPLLIEGGSYPAHKICGEFLSPECLHFLHDWNIHPIPIKHALFRTNTSSLAISFPSSAGGMSHIQLDPALVNLALKFGAKIKTNTQVISFQPKRQSSAAHLIQISNGETIEASHVIIATGRIPSYETQVPRMSYVGFKAHFENLDSDKNLKMFLFPGAYLGISPIEDNKHNVACLAKIEAVNEFNDPQLFIESLISQNTHLNCMLTKEKNLFVRWMVASVPSFGIKQTPDWLDTYFIGDAAVTIPPACGDGLSMAIFGGRLAAEYALRHRDGAQDFKRMWVSRCSSQIFWGKILHEIMLNSFYGNSLIHACNCFPYLKKKIFELTRAKSKE